MEKCKHEWVIFKDTELYGKGFLSFFCKHCLSLKKIKKEYKEMD